MIQKTRNALYIEVSGVDLMSCRNLEIYIKQSGFFRQYTPEVISSSELLVVVPYEDAMLLYHSDVRIQLAFTDENGNPRATKPRRVTVDELLKEAGYDPA